MGYDLYLKAELKGTFIPSDDEFRREIYLYNVENYDLWEIGNEKEVLEILGENIIDKGFIVSCNHKETYKRYRKYIKQLENTEETEKQYHLKRLKEFVIKYFNLG